MIHEIGPRFLVTRMRHGIETVAIEYGDNESTRREMKAGRALRTEVSIAIAMMGPRKAADHVRLAREVGK